MAPLFTSEQDVYDVLGTMFKHMVADPELADRLRGADTVVQYQLRAPESTITAKLTAEEPPEVQFGPTTWRTEVVLAMEADVAHRYFLGEVNPTTALAHGDIRASGPIAKILKLIPAVRPLGDRYRGVLTEVGRPELAGGEPVEAPADDAPIDPDAPAGDEAPAAEEVAPTEEA